jgi:hypothetical protein
MLTRPLGRSDRQPLEAACKCRSGQCQPCERSARRKDMRPMRPAVGLVTLLVAIGCSGGTTAARRPLPEPRAEPATATPVLGSKQYELPMAARGFGRAHPRSFSNGGDGTGWVRQITWTDWGARVAYGHGFTQVYARGGYPRVRAVVRAYHLGTCQGRPAYLRLSIRRAPQPSAPVSPRWERWQPTPRICTNWRRR